MEYKSKYISFSHFLAIFSFFMLKYLLKLLHLIIAKILI